MAYPLSYRQVEERMEERGVPVEPRDHPALGGAIQSPIGGSVSSPEAAGMGQLAPG